MKRIGATTRIAFAMAMWTATVLLGLRMTGVMTDGITERVETRTQLAETIAIHCSQFASRKDPDAIQIAMEALVHRHQEVESAACVFSDGSTVQAGEDHAENWDPQQHQVVSSTCISVPVLRGDEPFAEVQIRFRNAASNAWIGFLALPSVKITAIAALANLLGFLVLLRRCFQQLDPSRAVPERVRSALDTFAEGILVLDKDDRINLANRSFSQLFDRQPSDFQGKRIDELPWMAAGFSKFSHLVHRIADDQDNAIEVPSIGLTIGDVTKTLKPNASHVSNHEGKRQGYLLSLSDVTTLEEKNRQLEYLATRDPMTGCLNRRSFFDLMQSELDAARTNGLALSCLMVDVDHFKSVNDTYGHAMGDEVLKAVASTLQEHARPSDLVCRFGGEEFCLLLPATDLEGAKALAENYRVAIMSLEFEKLSVTASLGCSTFSDDSRSEGRADTFEVMQEQADQCLYHAKRHGRNQVVGYDQVLAAARGEADQRSSSESDSETELSPEKALLRSIQQLMSEARDAGNSEVAVDQLNEAIARV